MPINAMTELSQCPNQAATDLPATLAALRAAANAVCDQIHRDRITDHAHFACLAAESYVDDTGRSGLRVWIEPLNPTCYSVRRLIRDRLTALGFEQVRIEASDA